MFRMRAWSLTVSEDVAAGPVRLLGQRAAAHVMHMDIEPIDFGSCRDECTSSFEVAFVYSDTPTARSVVVVFQE